VHDSLLIQRGNEQMALKLAKYEADIQQAQIDLLRERCTLKEEELNSHQVLELHFHSWLAHPWHNRFLLYITATSE